MKEMILITGPAGSGKTTIGIELSKYLNQDKDSNKVFLIECDKIRNMFIGYIYQEEEEESFWFQILLNIVNFMKDKVDIIIIEGLFYESKCIDILKIKYPDIYLFLFEASLKTCLYRNSIRSQKDNILDNDEITKLYNLVRRNEYNKINVEAETKFIVKDILKCLKQNYQ